VKNSGVFSSKYSKNSLKLVYFDIQVLDRYFEDPKYLVFYSDYRGSIVLDDSYQPEDLEEIEYLKDFGLAYKKDNKYDRAVVCFAGDLASLPSKMQSHFHSFLLDNQKGYYPNYGFYKNLILGEWEENISIYKALVMEIHYINEMCSAIGIPKLFLQEYSLDANTKNEMPTSFHTILVPTEKRYYDFVITLEKMVTGNINKKAFQKDALFISTIESVDDNGYPKGSVTMLAEWMKKNIKLANIEDDVEKPLKKLVKERQTPAHKIFENKYDKSIWKKQDDFLREVYIAVRNIRLLLANHPYCSGVIIPDYLFDGEHIVSY